MSDLGFLPDATLEERCSEPPDRDPPDCRECNDTGWRDLEAGETALCECALRTQAEWRAVVDASGGPFSAPLTEADVPF